MSNHIKRILYAADDGEGSRRVLAYGIDLANRLGATLQVLRVIPNLREKSLVEIDGHVPRENLEEFHKDRIERTKEYIDAQIAAFYAVRADEMPARPISEVEVQEGDDVAERVLAEAQANSVDLILMGSRGEGLLAGLLFGSVVQEINRKSTVPLLLVPVRRQRT